MREARRLRLRWWVYCSVGFVSGHALFGLIGHGFTGPHVGRPVDGSALAHTTGLIGLGLTVFTLQRAALAPWLRISGKRVILATLAFVAAFQLGAYALRPPFDYIFGWPVLGVAGWISLDKCRGRRALLTAAALACFWLGLVALMIAVDPLLRSGAWVLDPSSLLDHTLLWIVGGGVTAIIGGYASGWPLSRLLLPTPVEPPDESSISAFDDRQARSAER